MTVATIRARKSTKPLEGCQISPVTYIVLILSTIPMGLRIKSLALDGKARLSRLVLNKPTLHCTNADADQELTYQICIVPDGSSVSVDLPRAWEQYSTDGIGTGNMICPGRLSRSLSSDSSSCTIMVSRWTPP